MTDLAIPNTFVSATLIEAAEVNANFAAIETLINTTGVPLVQAGSIVAASLAAGAVTEGKIADSAVTAAKIATGAVGSDELAADSVTAAKIATGAVGTSEIADDAVTAAEIATGAVGTLEIATGAVGSDELAADAVTAAKILTGAVGTSEIADSAVTAAKLAATAVATLGGVTMSHSKRSSTLSIFNATWQEVTGMTTLGFTQHVGASVDRPGEGQYLVFARCQWSISGSGLRGIRVTGNGYTITSPIVEGVAGLNQNSLVFGYIALAGELDTLMVEVYQSSGAAMNVNTVELMAFRLVD